MLSSVPSRPLRRRQGVPRSLTLAELVDEYLAQHDAAAVTVEKLRWLLGKAVADFGDLRLGELRSQEIAAWRMTIPPGHRFEATQALRQVLARAVVWGLLDDNPAKEGVDKPQRRRTEKRPFESWAELGMVTARLGLRYGPMVIFAAATVDAPRRVDRPGTPRHRHRSAGRLRPPRLYERAPELHQDRSKRAGRLAPGRRAGRARALTRPVDPLLFPAEHGGYLDLHNFRTRWKPAQVAAGVTPPRPVYDLRHTFATFALRAGISTFDLSRYMGASLTMIDRHYGHLARDGRDHAIRLLDTLNATLAQMVDVRGRPVDTKTVIR
jgi:integrase